MQPQMTTDDTDDTDKKVGWSTPLYPCPSVTSVVKKSSPMKFILLNAQIKTFTDGHLTATHNETLSEYIEDGVPVDAAVQDLGMRLARIVRTQETARREGVRQPKGDHTQIDT